MNKEREKIYKEYKKFKKFIRDNSIRLSIITIFMFFLSLNFIFYVIIFGIVYPIFFILIFFRYRYFKEDFLKLKEVNEGFL